MITLAADVGQSGSRLALEGDETCALLEGKAFAAGSEVVSTIEAIVLNALASLPARPERIDIVSIGSSGLNGQPAPAADLLARLSKPLGVKQVFLADDSVTSYLGAIGTQPGAVVAAGTGTVALATNAKDRRARVDGAGHLIGDAGSGYWIGRAGLERAQRTFDGREGSELLLDAARSHFGDLASLPSALADRADHVSAIASFAKVVAQIARAGDDAALQIWAAAARELATTAAAALRRCGLETAPVAVSVTGALVDAGDLLINPFCVELAHVCPRSAWVAPQGGGLDGARLLSSVALTPFGDLVASAGIVLAKPDRNAVDADSATSYDPDRRTS